MSVSAELLEPELPHDGMSFGELRRSYNFENVSSRGLLFTRLIATECEGRAEPVRALDIGCGNGIELRADYQWALRERLDQYWGLEPDSATSPPQGLFSTYLNALLEDAALPEDHFDVAYSFMVMEHVDDPLTFMRAVYRSLKPGGVYLFATPNSRHYFTRIAWALRKVRLDEAVLRLTRGEESDDYHYPVQYRFNSETRIRRTAERIGFTAPEFAYTEDRGPGDYFPPPLRFVYRALRAKRRLLRNPRSLITMVCRMSKPPRDS